MLGESPDAEAEGGLAADHPTPQTHTLLVGPTVADDFNTVRAALVPVGCWRLEDLRFEFDSSIVKPEAAKEFAKLATLCADHPAAPITLFGHADPVGKDTYNKELSGRRSEAVYALLTRDTAIWEKLYNTKIEGVGDAWKYTALQVMLRALGHDPGPATGSLNAQTIQAVKGFQRANGLQDDGDPGPLTRGALFPQYMDTICRDASGKPFTLAKTDFLGKGADPDGKADRQGCSEFNAVLMFSKAEKQKFDAPARKQERDAENAPNRRLMALLFRPGTEINPGKWPCPTTKEGTAKCEKRFWSDAARRRQFQDTRRTFEADKDTFACRFYQRLTTSSPCEGVKPVPPPVPLETVVPLIVIPAAQAPQDTQMPQDTPKANVAPSIGPNQVVVVKRPYTDPKRPAILLKTDTPFDGTGTFTRSSDHVRFFRANAEIQFDGKDNVFPGADLTTGVEVLAEGAKPSAAMDDITLTLTLSGGSKKRGTPAQAKMTSVEVTLDICEPRTSAADPPVLTTPAAAPPAGTTATDKFFGGRPVPVQFDGKIDERAMLIVRKVKPDAFKGKLVLNRENDKVRLFADEAPKAGETEIAFPHVLDPPTDPNGVRLFVEGAGPGSTAARDTGFRLGIQGVTDVGDRVAVTVCHTEIVSNKQPNDIPTIRVPEKPERKTESTFVVAPLIVGVDYDVEVRPFVKIAKPSAFAWSTASNKVELKDADKEILKLKGKQLSGALDDVTLELLLTTDIGKLKKRHRLTCVRVAMNPVTSGDNLKHTDDINIIHNPSGCVILTGGDASDEKKVPKYEITKIEPDLGWTEDDDRIAWWIVGDQPAGPEKYDGKADFRNDDKAKRGTKIQVFGTTKGDVLIQPYSGGYGYGMFRAHVVEIRKVKYRISRIFTTAQAAQPAQPAVGPLPAQAAQPAFPGGKGVSPQPAVPDLAAVPARPVVPATPARAARAPSSSHADAELHMKVVNIYLRQAGIEMVPDDSGEMARPQRAARPALPAVAAQPAIAAQVATPALPGVPAQPAVAARPAVSALPAVPEIIASVGNPRVGQAALDSKVVAVTKHSDGHFDVEVNDETLTFGGSANDVRSAMRINTRNEIISLAYVNSDATGSLAAARGYPANHAPQARANPPRAYTKASFTIKDKGVPSSSLKLKTGIPPSVPVDEVKMVVLKQHVLLSWEGSSPPTRNVNLLWGLSVPTTAIDASASGGDSTILAYGNTIAHEICHVLGMGHRGVAGDTFEDGLTIPANENLMHPSTPPPRAENLDIIQVKAIRFSEVLFRNP